MPPFNPIQETDVTIGLPGLRTWRAVYLAVGATFILWVALLAALTFLFPAAVPSP